MCFSQHANNQTLNRVQLGSTILQSIIFKKVWFWYKVTRKYEPFLTWRATKFW